MPLFAALDPRRSLRARFAWVLGGCGLAFGLIGALLVGAYEHAQVQQGVGQALRREAELMSRTLGIALQDRLQLVRQLAGQPVLSSGLMDLGEMRLLVEQLRAQQEEMSWLAITNDRGQVRVATGALLEGQTLSDEAWFPQGLKAPWIGERRSAGRLAGHVPLTRDGQESQYVDLAAPLIDYQGRTIGVAVARLAWSWVEALHLALHDEGQRSLGTDSLVLDRSGLVSIGPDELLGKPLHMAGMADLMAGGPPRVLVWPDGQRYLTALARGGARRGPSADLAVVVRQQEAQAFAAVDALTRKLVTAGVLAGLGFMALSIWLAGRIAKPVQALSAAAVRMAQGQPPGLAPVSTRRHDEVAELSRVMVVLHDELRERLAAEQRSTARFQQLFQGAPVAIYLSVDNALTMANTACLQLFGASHLDQLLGRSTYDMVHPDERALLKRRAELMREHHAAGRVAPMVEHRILRLDGTVRDVEITGLPLDVDGSPGVHVALRDITDRKRATQALAEREALLQQTSRLAQVGGWALDLATGQAEWTAEVSRMYGLPEDTQPTLALMRQSYPPEVWTRLEALVLAMARGGEPFDVEVPLRLPTARPRWMRVMGRAMQRGAQLPRIEGMVQDVTDRRRAEEAVRELNAQLEARVLERTAQLRAANAELDSFAYAVSHDLRAPLRAMSGFSQALIEDHGPQLNDDAKLYLEQITLASRRMGELIDGLLTLSRSTRGELRSDEVNLSTLALRALAELRSAEPGRQVQAEVAPELLVRGDARMLDVVMRNLVGNAWKYTGRCAEPALQVQAVLRDGRRWIEVADNGAGFDMAHAGRLFKAFARLHRQDEFNGIGIGLATVQRIVLRHGGEIVASGVPGQGARFRFWLPDASLPHTLDADGDTGASAADDSENPPP